MAKVSKMSVSGADLNWKLFDNFKRAAFELDLEVVPDPSYYSIVFKDKTIKAFCWTPLNKLPARPESGDLIEIECALSTLRDNFNDFHLEFSTNNYQVMVPTHNDMTFTEIKAVLKQMINSTKKTK